MRSPLRFTAPGVFLLAGSILLFEIALTRVFAIMLWHHFTYLVVSLALLGFGAGGSLLTARRVGRRTDEPGGALALYSTGYAVSVVLAFCFVTLVRIDSLQIWKDKANVLALLLIYLIATVPFLLGGLALGTALTRLSEHVHRIYFADLLGSAAGGAASVLLLSRWGSTATVMIAAASGALAAVLFSLGGRRRHLLVTAPALALGLWLAVAYAGGAATLGIPAAAWRIPFAPGKEAEAYGAKPDVVLHSATAEVEVGPSVLGSPMIGGDFGRRDTRPVQGRYVVQDGTAPTMLYEGAADLAAFPFLDDTQAASAYVARAAAGAPPRDVLVIGVGGGIDVMVALSQGARRVTAVEINTAMIRMVTDVFDRYLGGLFRRGAHPLADRIELVRSEGRAWMRARPDRYDVIQMSGVDSFTALSTGAYTLSESYLYTTDAVREFHEHLNEGGIANYSRFMAGAERPRETLRLANISATALRELNLDAGSRIAVFQGHQWASTMIKRGPFTAAEVEALKRFAREEGFRGLVYDPLAPGPFEPEAPAREAVVWTAAEAARNGLLRLPGGAAPEPRFLDGLAEAFLLVFDGKEAEAGARVRVLAEGLPERAAGEEELRRFLATAVTAARAEAGRGARARRDFATVVRGTAEERRAFEAAYPFDISPCTDDRPFFFNYYKYSGLLGAGREGGPVSVIDERYHPDFPVGHLVLVASLLQIAVLAFALILLPLRSLRREGVATPGKLRYFVYFAALGFGFMVVEIVLMQKMVLFLGHPTYAVSVVLTALLAAAGTGSLLAERFGRVGRRTLGTMAVLVVGAIGLNLFGVNVVLPLLLGWPLWARIGVVLLFLAPLGLALGMPFPSGLRVLRANAPDLIPWAWAVNGFLSVFSSIFCIALSMLLGFTQVLWLAAGVYALGFLVMKTERATAAPAPAEEPAAIRV